jgi:hypothetical protein
MDRSQSLAIMVLRTIAVDKVAAMEDPVQILVFRASTVEMHVKKLSVTRPYMLVLLPPTWQYERLPNREPDWVIGTPNWAIGGAL